MVATIDRTDTYAAFLDSKRFLAPSTGFDVSADDLNPALFPFQKDLVLWALRKGRAAIFATTGMGKTLMQLEYARLAAKRTLILAPLAVTQQTVAEGAKFGIPVTYARAQEQAAPTGITITNYEMLGHFDVSTFGAVVLDESGILKNYSGVIKRRLIETFRQTPMRLCCTATPAPNDTVELTNHADFLGVMKPSEMIAAFFISKGGDLTSGQYRLKRHARAAFFRWLASWSMSLTYPSDLGYDDAGFILPPLSIEPVIIPSDWAPPGQLLFTGLKGVTERSQARRATLTDRVAAAVKLIEAEPDEAWLVWTGLNDEANAVTAAIPGAVNVEGSQSPEHKATALAAFARGETRVLVTKPSLAAYGLNLQVCARMVFVGLGDSFEQYFQAIRRCWRFGQTRPVQVYIVLADIESAIHDNVMRKEAEHTAIMRELLAEVAGAEREEIDRIRTHDDYEPTRAMRVPDWLVSVPAASGGSYLSD